MNKKEDNKRKDNSKIELKKKPKKCIRKTKEKSNEKVKEVKTKIENKEVKKDEKKSKKIVMPKKELLFLAIAIVSIIMFTVALCPVTLQNDTFYTIKIGEHIVNEGKVDMVDPFSWHDNLPYTYPHWLYDVMIYGIYNLGGFLAIHISTIIFAIIMSVLMFFICRKYSKNNLVSFLLTLGAMYLLKDFIAARAQLVTFILFELALVFINQYLDTGKKRYPIYLFLIATLIANLHCAVWPFFFVLFIPFIAEGMIFRVVDEHVIYNVKKFHFKVGLKRANNKLAKVKKSNTKLIEKISNKIKVYNKKLKLNEEKYVASCNKVEERRKNPFRIKYYHSPRTKWLVAIMMICVCTGFLTPLGSTPFTYLINTMEGNTTQSINEHLPMTLAQNKEVFGVIAALFIFLPTFTDTKIRLKDAFFMIGLGYLMIMSRRQESLFVLLCVPMVSKLISDLAEKVDKGGCKKVENALTQIYGIVATLLIVALMSVYEFKPKVEEQFVNDYSYPVYASQFIKQNLDYKNIKLYNEYNYGSYLLFEGIPVFIDSRADLYAPEFNKTDDIFMSYINVSSINVYYEDTFNKYGITHVICYKNAKLNLFLSRDTNYRQIYSGIKDNFVIYERLNVK